MRILRFFWMALLLMCFHSALLAQSNCYETQRQRGIQLYNQGEYSAAYKNFEAAKMCLDLPSNNDLDSWMEKCVIHVRLSVKDLVFEAVDGEPQCVEVTTNAKTFKVGSIPDWCQISQQGKTLTVSCEDNPEVASRSANVTITAGGKSAVLEIFQRSADVAFSIEPDRVVFSSSEEHRFVMVNSNVPGWVVSSVPTWIVAERKSDSLLLYASKNTSSSARDAQVVLSVMDEEYPLAVRQLPGDTVITLSTHQLLVPSESSRRRFGVDCNVMGWTVSSPDLWMDFNTFRDSVEVVMEKNYSVFSRQGLIVVKNGTRTAEIVVHQYPTVSDFVMPPSELKDMGVSDRETILVTSYPSKMKIYVDDSVEYRTPFEMPVDYEHHSLLSGFERREYFFNDKIEDLHFAPGIRFASITFASPKAVGLMTGFVSAKKVGAFIHFQKMGEAPKYYAADTVRQGSYHLAAGAVYCPLPYLGVYGGVGMGVHTGYTRFGFDYEVGVMGFYQHVMLTLGFQNSHVGMVSSHPSFMFGIGGYLKQYYDPHFGYCGSDSRRWWSVSYVFRPAEKGRGVMFGDLGAGRVRAYIKGMYTTQEAYQNIDASIGLMFTPVNGIIDLCMGAGAAVNVRGLENRFQGFGGEVGVVVNLWRFPITVMVHELDMFSSQRRMCFDFGVGFHLGEFNRTSYK